MSTKFSEWCNASKPPKADGMYEIQQDPKSDISFAEWDGKRWKSEKGISITPKNGEELQGHFLHAPSQENQLKINPA